MVTWVPLSLHSSADRYVGKVQYWFCYDLIPGYVASGEGVGSYAIIGTRMPLKTSKLCQSFPKIMQESSSMLEYFIQYMDSVNALHLVQFWLAVKSFKALNASQTSVGKNTRPSDTVGAGSGSPSETSSCTKASCDTTTAGSHIGCSRTSKDTADTSVGGARHGVLRRRDTENHKYCNCGISMSMHQQTPPLTPKQGSRTDMSTSQIQQESNSGRSLKEDCEYSSPRLKEANANMHTVVLTSKDPISRVKDVALTDMLESKDQLKNQPSNIPPDVLSSSSGPQPKYHLPDVIGLTDRTQEAPSLKEPSPDASTQPLDLLPNPTLSMASKDVSPSVHTSDHVPHSTNLS